MLIGQIGWEIIDLIRALKQSNIWRLCSHRPPRLSPVTRPMSHELWRNANVPAGFRTIRGGGVISFQAIEPTINNWMILTVPVKQNHKKRSSPHFIITFHYFELRR